MADSVTLKRIIDLVTQADIDSGVYTIIDSVSGAVKKYPLGSLICSIAPIFDATEDYYAGAYCNYNGQLYRFTEAHAAGDWDGSDAQAVILSDIVTDLRSDNSKLNLAVNNYGIVASDASLWESGVISSANGNNVSMDTFIRTVGYIPSNIIRELSDTGYLVTLYAYDSTGSYVGAYQGDTYEKTSALFASDIPFIDAREYQFRAVAKKEDGTAISASDGSKIKFVYATDESLSVLGAGADAKKTGEIKSNVERLYEWEKCDPDSYIRKYYNSSNNTWVDNENYYTVKFDVNDIIKLKTTLRMTNASNGVSFFDENNNYLGGQAVKPSQTTTYTNLEVVPVTGTKWIYISCFVTDLYPVSMFVISDYRPVTENLLNMMDESHGNYDAAGNYESNIVYYNSEIDANLVKQYDDANRITGCYIPHALDWLMLSVRIGEDDTGSGAYLDFANNTCGFFTPLPAYDGNTDITKETETAIPFTLASNHPYIVIDDIVGLTQTVTFIDGYTLDEIVITKEHASGRDRCGYCDVTYQLGATGVESAFTKKYVKAIMLQPISPKLLIIGDSYVNGYFPYRWATKVKRDLKGNAYLSGRSGSGSAVMCVYFEQILAPMIKPQYAVWGLGTNDTDATEWQTYANRFISKCAEIGATPVFVTTPIIGGSNTAFVTAHNAAAATINAWIKNSGYLYSDVSIILTQNYDGVTQNTSLFLDDRVHPNRLGFELMYKKFKADLPYLCEN